MAHNLTIGVTLSPCSTLDGMTPHSSILYVTLPPCSASDVVPPPCLAKDVPLPPSSTEDITAPTCHTDDPCFAVYVAPPILFCKVCHSSLWSRIGNAHPSGIAVDNMVDVVPLLALLCTVLLPLTPQWPPINFAFMDVMDDLGCRTTP